MLITRFSQVWPYVITYLAWDMSPRGEILLLYYYKVIKLISISIFSCRISQATVAANIVRPNLIFFLGPARTYSGSRHTRYIGKISSLI